MKDKGDMTDSFVELYMQFMNKWYCNSWWNRTFNEEMRQSVYQKLKVSMSNTYLLQNCCSVKELVTENSKQTIPTGHFKWKY
jgi:hypothetical protein